MTAVEFIISQRIDPDVKLRVELIEEGSLADRSVSLEGASPSDFAVEAMGFVASLEAAITVLQVGKAPVVLIGTGTGSDDEDDLRRIGAAVAKASFGSETISVVIGQSLENLGPLALRYLTEGFLLGAYSFNKYRSDPAELAKVSKTRKVSFVVSDLQSMQGQDEIALARAVAGASCLARDLVNEPAGVLTPTAFADKAIEIAQGSERLSIEVWDLDRILVEKLGGLLGVARGSVEEPRVVKLTYSPRESSGKKIVLVGKGITFDSGGLNIKSYLGMKTMKIDMSGAAAVLGSMAALEALDVKATVVGFMMMTENMPSGSATKPGDVLITRSGKTIEVLNTDAEGRLVLSDGLSLATEESPDYIIDVATLTGACVVALGNEIAGVLGNSPELITALSYAADLAGEPIWELPLPERYRKHIRSEIADMKNMGEPGQAGTIAGAMLLSEFVGDVPWAHLDIAGPSYSESEGGYLSKGGTGFGARLLCYFLEELAG